MGVVKVILYLLSHAPAKRLKSSEDFLNTSKYGYSSIDTTYLIQAVLSCHYGNRNAIVHSRTKAMWMQNEVLTNEQLGSNKTIKVFTILRWHRPRITIVPACIFAYLGAYTYVYIGMLAPVGCMHLCWVYVCICVHTMCRWWWRCVTEVFNPHTLWLLW